MSSSSATALARGTGRVRMAGINTPNGQIRTVRGSDLLITGIDLSGELAGMLASMQPRIAVHYIDGNEVDGSELLAACGGDDRHGEIEVPEVVVVAAPLLDTTTLGWMRRIVANTRLPVVAIVEAHPAQRSALRRRAQEVGALDCLLRSELSAALLEAVIAHARNHGRNLARLSELRDRFALAIRGARDGMWEWDLVRGRVFYSQRWRELLELGADDIKPVIETWLGRVHPQDIGRLRRDLEALIKGQIPRHESEHRVRDSEGNWRWVMSHAVVHHDGEGKPLRMAGSLADITSYRVRETEIRERSRQDQLTKLPDRRVFLERLARAVEIGRSHRDYQFVVLLIEVDRMAQIRDSYGMGEAERVFALMAKRMEDCLGREGVLFCFDTGKLAILLEDVEDPSVGTHIADLIHQAVADPFEIGGAASYTTVSIGMTSSAHGYQRAEDVIADVSSAADTARDRGRNRHEIYDSSMRIEARTLLALEMSLRRAIDENQLRLHYQPIRWIDTRTILGFEALMR
ncbi:MAG: diguanylate cyclase, partial [Myxococcales bacterium]|nr:diguanylate cyclase [Myxococcales bacterium]